MKYSKKALTLICLAGFGVNAVFCSAQTPQQKPEEQTQKQKEELAQKKKEEQARIQKLEKDAQSLVNDKKFEEAAEAFRSLAEDNAVPMDRKFHFYSRVNDLYMNNLRDFVKSEVLNRELLKMDFNDLRKTQITHRLARALVSLKQTEEAEKLERSVFMNSALEFKDRLPVFEQFANRVGQDKKADKKEMFALVDDFLKLTDLTPGQFASLQYLFVRYGNAEQKEKAANAILANEKTPAYMRSSAAIELARYLSKNNKISEAAKVLEKTIAGEGITGGAKLNLVKELGKILLWEEKYDAAIALYRKSAEQEPMIAPAMFQLIADAYLDAGREKDALNVMREQKNITGEISILYKTGEIVKAKEMALAILSDEKQPEKIRAEMFNYFCDDISMPNDSTKAPVDRNLNRKVRAQYGDLYAKASYEPSRSQINAAMWQADHVYALELLTPFYKLDKLPTMHRFNYVHALCGVERFKEAAEAAKLQSGNKTLTPAEQHQMSLFAEMLDVPLNAQKAAFEAVNKTFKDEKSVTQKIQSDNLLNVGRHLMLGKRFEQAENVYNLWRGLFKQNQEKRYTLNFLDTPVYGVSDMLRLSLNAQLLDRPYGGNTDFMVTDVSTGDRGVSGNTGDSGKNAFTEFSAVCDENGIHLLFNAHDDKAREVEAKQLGAGCYEMYLAAGENQPYVCILPDLQSGKTPIWQTSYNSPNHVRIKDNDRMKFRSEHNFHEKGYRTYIFISWDYFADKLPEKGDAWEFDNIHWGRSGGLSWNGTRVIHGRSTWGKLDFNITPEQLTKIKRKIVLQSAANYKKEKRTSIEQHGIFSRWNDPVLGDPEFYQAKLRPLEEKLDAYLPLAVPGMDDATVEKVFLEAVPSWRALPFITAKLRREYMAEQLCK